MIEKLRSRHPIDLPTSGFGRSKGLIAAIGGLALLFVLVPLLAALYAGVVDVPLAVGIAVAAVVLAMLVAATRGKSGHARS